MQFLQQLCEMPELTDHQLKERVQKLENLLRVNVRAFSIIPSFHVIDFISSVDHLTQAREERIVALETENAMLYLKLAQVDLKLITTRLRLV